MPRDAVRQILVESAVKRRVLPLAFGRALDVVVSVSVLVFLAPLLAVLAVLVRTGDPGPVLFGHVRIGRDGRRFRVWKFRSMRVDGDAILAEHLARDPDAAAEWALDHKLRSDPRITKLGRFLRRSSLDELPQLLNVLRGEMSLVGPRPIVEAEIERYGRFFGAYCSVRPGITGVWQVSGRNDVSYQRRVEMDALYARDKSLMLDLRILMQTVPAVLGRRGSY